ncbi:MAG: hypothetical protein ABI990_09575, partial [Actinomycetota bacterium]
MRRAVLSLCLLTGLAVVPLALAWTTLTSGVQNTVVASILVTQQGGELVSWDSPVGGTISISRNHGPAKVLVTGDPAANRTQLVEQPSGAIQLYYPNAQGVGRLTSTDDGQIWSANVQTQSHVTGSVMAAAVGADGTPYFAQDSTAGVNVFRGLNGEYMKNVFP